MTGETMAVIGMGLAIIGLNWRMYAVLRADNAALRRDLDAKLGALRSDLDAKIGALRSDLDAKIGALRSDLDAKISALRSDLDAKISALQADVSSIKERLTGVETTLGLLIKGLHIEVSGRGG